VIQPGASGDVIYGAFRLVTELYPSSPQAWFELGRVYQRGRRPAEAGLQRLAELARSVPSTI